jgi:L-histidine N-alpha-methyltransferase
LPAALRGPTDCASAHAPKIQIAKRHDFGGTEFDSELSIVKSAISAQAGDWLTVERGGFTIFVDSRRQSPLAFALSVAEGLDSRPRRLDASYLYDAAGSALFERITEQPEYYLTRAEDRLLLEHAAVIRELAGPSTLVELGSGASLKTQRLLDAWTWGGPASYIAVDVDAQAIEQACVALRRRYADPARLSLRGIAATYERALAMLPGSEQRTIAFLGSSLGNLGWQEYPAFCELVAGALRPGDHFLVGLDLVKSPARIEAAYNDRAGVTAAFTRNLFARMNRDLHTRVPESAIAHVAYYDAELERVEIFAEALQEFAIHIPVLGRQFRIARGERILTEVSHKFRPAAFIATVEAAGLQARWHTTEADEFGLFLFKKPAPLRAVPRRSARVGEWRARLAALRARTRQILEPLSETDLTQQHSSLMSPLAWDLGHIAEYEAAWLLPPGHPLAAAETAPLYDPLATPRAERSKLALPAVPEVWQRLQRVREAVEELLLGAELGGRVLEAELPAREFSMPLVLEHEAQHQETLLQAIALREDLDYRPSFARDASPRSALRPAPDRVLIPAGAFTMAPTIAAWRTTTSAPRTSSTCQASGLLARPSRIASTSPS